MSAAVDIRREQGRSVRQIVRRRQIASFGSHTADEARDILERSSAERLPELVPLKNMRMAASAFAYFRGAVPLMAHDLASQPHTGLLVQLSGDAHIRNLGAYAAPDGRLLFDLNDFDETIRGPFEWDLKRLATSILLAGLEAGHSERSSADACRAAINRYVRWMTRFARMPLLEVARFGIHRLKSVEPVHAALEKAIRQTPAHTLSQLTLNGRFRSNPPLLRPLDTDEATPVLAALHPYQQTLAPERQHLLSFYRPVDLAFKVVGTGSVGLRDYCIYLEGNNEHDALFLQVKEEPDSAWATCLPNAHPPTHNGQRVAEGQRAMQVSSDPLLGWTSIDNRHYLVRQLADHKGSVELDDLAGDGLAAYALLCGELLARAHARTGDPAQLAGYIGLGDRFAESIADFAHGYAHQTIADWQAHRASFDPLQ